MKRIETDEELRRIHDDGSGFIYNNFGGDGRTPQMCEFNKLHRADCRECDPRRTSQAMTVRTSGQKLFFRTSDEASKYLIGSKQGYTKCTICDPR